MVPIYRVPIPRNRTVIATNLVMMMNHFLFRKQVLNWEYLLSIPSLLVRLPVTVADDILKVYRAREVILGFFWRFRLIVLDVGGARRFHDCPRLGATGLFSFMSMWWMPP